MDFIQTKIKTTNIFQSDKDESTPNDNNKIIHSKKSNITSLDNLLDELPSIASHHHEPLSQLVSEKLKE